MAAEAAAEATEGAAPEVAALQAGTSEGEADEAEAEEDKVPPAHLQNKQVVIIVSTLLPSISPRIASPPAGHVVTGTRGRNVERDSERNKPTCQSAQMICISLSPSPTASLMSDKREIGNEVPQS